MYTDHATNCTLFARNVMNDPDLAFMTRRYSLFILIGLLIPLSIGAAASATVMGAVNGFLWGGLVRMFLVQQIYYGSGSVSHMFGGRPFDTGDNSTNNWLLGIPTFGSAYQNNHHAFPTSAMVGLRWYQPDVGMMILRVLQSFGWVSDLKQPSVEQTANMLRLRDEGTKEYV
jgi:stearoyl-CoA desaturase (delta-9 desaturase)